MIATSTPRPKVLYISSVRFFSGSEVLLADYLRNNPDIEPLLAAPESHLLRSAFEAGARVHRMASLGELQRKRKPWWPLEFLVRAMSALVRLVALIRRERPQIVHANNFAAALYAFLPALLTRTPFVWHIYDMFPRGSVENLTIRSLSARTAAVVVPSEATAAHLKSLGISSNNLHVVHNGVDCHGRFDPRSHGSARIRDSLGISPQTFLIAMCGQLVEWKGLHVLLDAIELLEAPREDVRYVLVGSAPRHSAAYLAAQQGRIKRSEVLADRVIFLGWRRDMPEVINDLDVVVVPSVLPDPLPTIVIESMSLGKPVVGACIGGIPEMVEEGTTGLLFEPGDAAQLADKIEWMQLHRDRAEEMGREARRKVIADFSLDRYRHDILEIYRDLCQPRSSA